MVQLSSSVTLRLRAGRADCRSDRLPFPFRDRVSSSPAGWGVEVRACGREGAGGQRLIILSCPVKKQTCDRALGKVKCRWTPSILRAWSRRLHRRALSRLGGPLLAALPISTVSALKAGFVAASHRLGWRVGGEGGTPRLICMGGLTVLSALCTPAHTEPCPVPSVSCKYFGGWAGVPHGAVGPERPGEDRNLVKPESPKTGHC